MAMIELWYRCRMCDEKYSNYRIEHDSKFELISDILSEKRWSRYGMLAIHVCDNERRGVADFIGVQDEEGSDGSKT